jgi:hypothetical protein
MAARPLLTARLMRSRFTSWVGTAVCLVALLATFGSHWLALQSVAWVRMLTDYARSGSFTEAIEKTFDGKHPCSLCLKVRHGRQEQERQQQKIPSLKTEADSDLFCQAGAVSAPEPPSWSTDAVPFVPHCFFGFLHSPPKPPPRS